MFYVKVILAENEAELKALHFAEFSDHCTWQQLEPFVKEGNAFSDGVSHRIEEELEYVKMAIVYRYDPDEEEWFIRKCSVYTDGTNYYVKRSEFALV